MVCKTKKTSKIAEEEPVRKSPRKLKRKAEEEKEASSDELPEEPQSDSSEDVVKPSPKKKAKSKAKAKAKAPPKGTKTSKKSKKTEKSDESPESDNAETKETKKEYVPAEPWTEAVWRKHLGDSWYEALKDELTPDFLKNLGEIDELRKTENVYPKHEDLFKAFRLTPLDKVRVVILGQDPYFQEGLAMGLCFSIPKGKAVPGSLKNIYRELGIADKVHHGDLTSWTSQG
eukprot:Platyproteum_vivax@DN16921_c0_g1_i1.p1